MESVLGIAALEVFGDRRIQKCNAAVRECSIDASDESLGVAGTRSRAIGRVDRRRVAAYPVDEGKPGVPQGFLERRKCRHLRAEADGWARYSTKLYAPDDAIALTFYHNLSQVGSTMR